LPIARYVLIADCAISLVCCQELFRRNLFGNATKLGPIVTQRKNRNHDRSVGKEAPCEIESIEVPQYRACIIWGCPEAIFHLACKDQYSGIRMKYHGHHSGPRFGRYRPSFECSQLRAISKG